MVEMNETYRIIQINKIIISKDDLILVNTKDQEFSTKNYKIIIKDKEITDLFLIIKCFKDNIKVLANINWELETIELMVME